MPVAESVTVPSTMELDREPEIAHMFEGEDPPPWVTDVVRVALAADPEEAASWSEALALAFGRRANRIVRERLDFEEHQHC